MLQPFSHCLAVLSFLIYFIAPAKAEVCKSENGFRAHKHGCVFGGYLWSAPLNRDVTKTEAEEYCKSLPHIAYAGGWQIPSAAAFDHLVIGRAHLRFEASLDNMFWSSGRRRGPGFLINGITGNVLEDFDGARAGVICAARFRLSPQIEFPYSSTKPRVVASTYIGYPDIRTTYFPYTKSPYRPGVLRDSRVVVLGGSAEEIKPYNDQAPLNIPNGTHYPEALHWLKDGELVATYKSAMHFRRSPVVLSNDDVVVAGYEESETGEEKSKIVWLRDGKSVNSVDIPREFSHHPGLALSNDTVVFSNGRDRILGAKEGKIAFNIPLNFAVLRHTDSDSKSVLFDLMWLSDDTIVAVNTIGLICWVQVKDDAVQAQRCEDSHDNVVQQPVVSNGNTVIIRSATNIKRFSNGLFSHGKSSDKQIASALPDEPSEEPVIWFTRDWRHSDEYQLRWLDKTITYQLDPSIHLLPRFEPFIYSDGTVLVLVEHSYDGHVVFLWLKDGVLRQSFEIPQIADQKNLNISSHLTAAPVVLPNGDIVLVNTWEVFGNGIQGSRYFSEMKWIRIGG